ncbi:uncharacterized protein F4822DRAFT_403336 [Hypoxylon trugodes]|uniref:uncharacterized protein n=1 Tax=Hypoxylon trugodes TaxID=326681 RepID=UPI00218DDF3F|nr:uncharacterized protein F4822DRAFT_403336 [Hypoxylon trugodes]KAI1388611.1 hypothetical protein F4822DRAFT_403336 [Hypoxylon trugodes]
MINVEHSSSLPGSPDAAPLQPISPDRINQQRDASMFSSIRTEQLRDSDVHDKIRQFNNMTHTNPGAASMSRQLERKTADAALKRAMLGREEAESEMRRYREEARVLRRHVEESRGRERKVGERLEDVMEKYGQAKETLQHSKAIWEKEIRQARKEVFKTQSSIVKLQEELKSVRAASKSTEESLAREKELSKAREQEAFASRYQLVEVQQQLEKALERIAFVERERDAYKAAAQSEEIARIAAEGRLPLPPEEPDTEFASPKKDGRVSLSTVDILSSAASENEIEELTRLWQWEKQRADRTQEQLDFMQAECELRFCRGARTRARRSTRLSGRQERLAPVTIVDPADRLILGRKSQSSELPTVAEPKHEEQHGEQQEQEKQEPPQIEETPPPVEEVEEVVQKEEPKERKEPRRSTIFVPSEGIFRTLSQQDLRAANKSDESASEPPTPVDPQPNPPYYSRTPSVDPPTFALLAQERTSLLSLLNAPRESESHCTVINIPTTSAEAASEAPSDQEDEDVEYDREETVRPETRAEVEREELNDESRPHTSAAFYAVTTTTTMVPVRDDKRTSANRQPPSFDINNPALTPTMTREQALAQIKERRGRARSAAQGQATPRRQMVTGVGDRRDVSAPAVRAAKGRSA